MTIFLLARAKKRIIQESQLGPGLSDSWFPGVVFGPGLSRVVRNLYARAKSGTELERSHYARAKTPMTAGPALPH